MSVISSSDLIGRAPGGRKLVAVVHADMVGYSSLIGLDDMGTLERLRTLRSTLIDPAINDHGGRIVQTAGDFLLVVFDSIDGAVRCAVKVQQLVPDYDGDQFPDRAIRFRVGINIGDVIADGTDLHGDGVNVAVRLQAECPPGGICVSRAVRDHVHGRLDLVFDELGALSLKNIHHPVEAFLLRLGPVVPMAETPKPASDQPSIAVLSFTCFSDEREFKFLTEAMTEDLITMLARIPGFIVIARQSSFAYQGRSVDSRQIGRELGVRYIIEGSLRPVGRQLRVGTQLIDATSGAQLWADRLTVRPKMSSNYRIKSRARSPAGLSQNSFVPK